MKTETCDGCGKPTTQWTITKGFDLLCDGCLLGRLAEEHREARGVTPEKPRTLENGYVRVRDADTGVRVEYDPKTAALLLNLRNLDRQVIANCTEHLR